MMTAQASHPCVNENNVYAIPYQDIECDTHNDPKFKPEHSTGEEQSMYMNLKEKKEPENAYQSLKTSHTGTQST